MAEFPWKRVPHSDPDNLAPPARGMSPAARSLVAPRPLSAGAVTVSGSTLTGNSATYGGGIYNLGTLTIRDSTLLGNSALLGGDLYNAGLVSLFNSIIGDRYDL